MAFVCTPSDVKPSGSHHSLADTISQYRCRYQVRHPICTRVLNPIFTGVGCKHHRGLSAARPLSTGFWPHEWFHADGAELTDVAALEMRSPSPSLRRSGIWCHFGQTGGWQVSISRFCWARHHSTSGFDFGIRVRFLVWSVESSGEFRKITLDGFATLSPQQQLRNLFMTSQTSTRGTAADFSTISIQGCLRMIVCTLSESSRLLWHASAATGACRKSWTIAEAMPRLSSPMVEVERWSSGHRLPSVSWVSSRERPPIHACTASDGRSLLSCSARANARFFRQERK